MRRHQGAFDFLRREGTGSLLYRQLQPCDVLDVASGNGTLGILNTFLEVFERDSGLAHLFRVVEHLVFGHTAAQHRDLPHTRDGKQAVTQLKLPHAAHFQRVSGLIAQQGDEHNLTRHRNDGSHLHFHMGRQVLAHRRQAFRHNLASQVNIGIPVKINPDEGKSAAAGTAHLLHAGRAGKSRFQGDGDILLHFLRGEAGCLCLNRDTRHIQLREHIHRSAHDTHNA